MRVSGGVIGRGWRAIAVISDAAISHNCIVSVWLSDGVISHIVRDGISSVVISHSCRVTGGVSGGVIFTVVH